MHAKVPDRIGRIGIFYSIISYQDPSAGNLSSWHNAITALFNNLHADINVSILGLQMTQSGNYCTAVHWLISHPSSPCSITKSALLDWCLRCNLISLVKLEKIVMIGLCQTFTDLCVCSHMRSRLH